MIVPLLQSFGPMLAFFAVEWAWGPVAALVASAGTAVIAAAPRLWRREPLPPMLLAGLVLSVGFGAIELWSADPRVLQWEPVVSNALVAAWFGRMAMADPGPLVDELRSTLPGRLDDEPDLGPRLQVVLAAFAAWSAVKGVSYGVIRWVWSPDEAFGLETAVGIGTFVALLAFCRYGVDPILDRRARS